MKMRGWAVLVTAMALPVASPAAAQDAVKYLPDSASPFGVTSVTNADAASVTMPKLAFKGDGSEAADFDKYYVFHRPNTDFATAYADLAECDGYARGLQANIKYQEVPYPYTGTMAGVIGGAIGNAIASAVFGSGEIRRLRRVNMRTCMNYKGYDRYGLPKDLWNEFNFEEGFGSVKDEKRSVYLKQQALVASAPTKPQGEPLGL